MQKSKTNRGFDIVRFTDSYGENCSLQKSSLADYVWLGLNDVKPKVLASKYLHLAEKRTDCKPSERFTGWIEYPLPEDIYISSRMHLNRELARELAKSLMYFADHGELP